MRPHLLFLFVLLVPAVYVRKQKRYERRGGTQSSIEFPNSNSPKKGTLQKFFDSPSIALRQAQGDKKNLTGF